MLNVNVEFLQTLSKLYIIKKQYSDYNRTDVYFLCIVFSVVALDSFFLFGGQKKWSLVALDRWSTIV